MRSIFYEKEGKKKKIVYAKNFVLSFMSTLTQENDAICVYVRTGGFRKCKIPKRVLTV